MYLRKIEPAVYADDCNERGLVNLGEVAEICGRNPQSLWKELIEMKKGATVFLAAVISEDRMLHYFYLDYTGRVYEFGEANKLKKPRFNVGGDEENTVGGWKDVYFSKDHGLKLIGRPSPEIPMVTWEKVEINWDGSSLAIEAQKKICSSSKTSVDLE